VHRIGQSLYHVYFDIESMGEGCLCNVYSLQLISAYAGVIECSHLVGWTGWGKTYEEIGKNR